MRWLEMRGSAAGATAVASAAAALFLVAIVAQARPPKNADPALAPWFHSLHTAEGDGCCSTADCRPVEYRIADDHYEALIGHQYGDDVEPHWEAVPQERILLRVDNPTGRAIACWMPIVAPHILCFVLPAQV